MSNFQKRIDSKVRVNALEKVFIEAIEDFSNNNQGLTVSEVNSVMLKMLTQSNEGAIKDSLN